MRLEDKLCLRLNVLMGETLLSGKIFRSAWGSFPGVKWQGHEEWWSYERYTFMIWSLKTQGQLYLLLSCMTDGKNRALCVICKEPNSLLRLKGLMDEEGISYSFIIYGMGDTVACKNNIAYWYAMCLSHIQLRTQRNTRQETTLTWQLFLEV